jgi:hypothetical protein
MMLPPGRSRQAQLIETNLKNVFIAMSCDQKKYKNTEYLYLFSHIPHAIFNCVINIHTNENEIEKIIETISNEYKSNDKEHCWWVTERSDPQSIIQYLLKYGFQKGPVYRGMHVNIENANLTLEMLPKIRVEKIQHIDAIDQWAKPLAEGFKFSQAVSVAFALCYKALFSKDRRFINYVAYYEDQLAGSATLFLDKDSAGLYNGAVYSKFRNKGVLTSLAQARLLEAKEQGINEVIIHANNASYNVAAKAGFKEYLTIQGYLSQ